MPDVVLTRKFDARNGNNAAIGADTYPNATIIAYQDAAAKTETIEAICNLAHYDALPAENRPSKQAFFNREINGYLRDRVKQYRVKQAQAAVQDPDIANLPQ